MGLQLNLSDKTAQSVDFSACLRFTELAEGSDVRAVVFREAVSVLETA